MVFYEERVVDGANISIYDRKHGGELHLEVGFSPLGRRVRLLWSITLKLPGRRTSGSVLRSDGGLRCAGMRVGRWVVGCLQVGRWDGLNSAG